jgi:hypothetical protein
MYMPILRKLAGAVIAVSLACLVLASVTRNSAAHERLNVAYASAAALKGSMQSPRNLEFEAVRITDTGAACMQYRVAVGGQVPARAVVLGNDVARSDARDGRFAAEWNRQCLGLAHDLTREVDRFF